MIRHFLSTIATFSLLVSPCLLRADSTPPQPFINALQRALDADASWVMVKTVATLPRPLVSSGVVSCFAGKGIRWETRLPFPVRIEMNKTELLLAHGNDQPTPEDVPHYAKIREAVDHLLAGETDAFSSIFKQETLPATNGWSILLQPTESHLAQFLHEVRLSGAKDLTYAQFLFHDGSLTKIHFTPTAHAAHNLWKK